MIHHTVFLVKGRVFNRFRTAARFAIKVPPQGGWDVVNIWTCPVNIYSHDPEPKRLVVSITRDPDSEGFMYTSYLYAEKSLEYWWDYQYEATPPTPGSRRARLIGRINKEAVNDKTT